MSIFVMSISGPFGPIFFGVWQSLHARTETRYFPRWTAAEAACGAGFGAALAAKSAAVPATTAAARNKGFPIFIIFPPSVSGGDSLIDGPGRAIGPAEPARFEPSDFAVRPLARARFGRLRAGLFRAFFRSDSALDVSVLHD